MMKFYFILLLMMNILFSNLLASNYGYVISRSHTMERVNIVTGQVELDWGAIGILNDPEGIAISGNYAYIVNWGSQVMDRVLLSDGTADATWATGFNRPSSIAISGAFAYVGNGNGEIDKITIADGTRASAWATSTTAAIEMDTDGTYLYVCSQGAATIDRINLSTQVKDVTWVTGAWTGCRDISIDNGFAYILTAANTVSKLNLSTSSIEEDLATGFSDPRAIDIGGGFGWISNNGEDLDKFDLVTGARTDAVVSSIGTNRGLAFAVLNYVATGATISGSAKVGYTLTADTSGITDTDGLSTPGYTYQWTANDVNIGAATNSTYLLTSNEIGKTIKVVLNFTDDNSNAEILMTTATSAVVDATIEDSVPAVDGSFIGDGNNDGTQDSLQDYVQSKQFNGTQWLTGAITDDGASTITITQSAAADGLIPSNLTAPFGKFAVDMTGISGDKTITLFIPYNSKINSLYKLNRVTTNYDLISSAITHFAGDNKTRIVYTVANGGIYDQDGVDNTTIQDPVIPAAPAPVNAPISPKAYIFLALAILGIGLFQYRRRVV